jgi:hypothetical protein
MWIDVKRKRQHSDPNWIAQTARLMETQAVHLSTLDLLDQVPGSWSLSLVSSFLERSFRRELSKRNETQLLKAIAMGENLQIGEAVWDAQRRLGGTLAEDATPTEDQDGAEEVKLAEEKLAEKGDGGRNDGDVVELDLDADASVPGMHDRRRG